MSGLGEVPATGTSDATLFVGRDREVREIAALLTSMQSVSVIGLPGMGKSALLRHVAHPATWRDAGRGPEAILAAYVDCTLLHVRTSAEVFGALAEGIVTAAEVAGVAAEPALAAAVAHPSRLMFEAAVRRLNERGARVLLVLDGFEQLSSNRQLGVAVFNALRSAAARFALVYLTASVRPLVELTEDAWAQDLLSSPFFNIFAPLWLGPLGEDEARQLIRALCRTAHVEAGVVSDAALYRRVGGSPLALRLAVHEAVAAIGEDDEGAQRAGRALTAHYAAVWQALTPQEQAAQRDLEGSVLQARADAPARAVLQGLVRKGVLVADGRTVRYAGQAWARFVSSGPALVE